MLGFMTSNTVYADTKYFSSQKYTDSDYLLTQNGLNSYKDIKNLHPK